MPKLTYAEHEDLLPEPERERLLGIIRLIRQGPPTRPQAAVDRELREIRRGRRTTCSPAKRRAPVDAQSG